MDVSVGSYCRPVQANFPAVDAVLLLDSVTLLFQFTVSARHPVTPAGFANVLRHLPTGASRNVVLVYVVPEGATGTAACRDFHMSPVDSEHVKAALELYASPPKKQPAEAVAQPAPPAVALAICVAALPVG